LLWRSGGILKILIFSQFPAAELRFALPELVPAQGAESDPEAKSTLGAVTIEASAKNRSRVKHPSRKF